MKNLGKHRNKIIAGLIIILVVFGISRIDFRSTEDYYNQDNTTEQLNSSDSSTSDATLNGALQNNSESNKTSDYSKGENIDPKAKNSVSSSSNNESNSSETIKVTIYIDVRNLNKASNNNKLKPELRKYVPANGYVLSKTTIEVAKDATAFDVLMKATRLNRIQMEYQGASENIYNSVYIQGINHIYEFSAGSESGWMYSINGSFPNYGMSAVTVKNKDVLRVVYTCDLGCDVGHSMKSCN
ncbi:DUF4430 domain-containing protein [Erysipelotrichaceae bacterium OttesenSCG-928-M19]|nr:DUF4430 domain-containing protein [Erysipelotrichaceae bacterium OttesenSCG-928-M19]